MPVAFSFFASAKRIDDCAVGDAPGTMLTPLEIEVPPCHLAGVISGQTSSANVRPHGVDRARRRSLSTYPCGIRSEIGVAFQ